MPSNEAMLAEIDSQRQALKRSRERERAKTEEIVDAVGVVAGGAAAGYVAAKYSGKELFGLTPNLAIGTGLTVVGMMGWAGKNASRLSTAVGTGVLAYEVGTRVAAKVSQQKPGTVSGQFSGAVDIDQLEERWAELERGRRAA